MKVCCDAGSSEEAELRASSETFRINGTGINGAIGVCVCVCVCSAAGSSDSSEDEDALPVCSHLLNEASSCLRSAGKPGLGVQTLHACFWLCGILT